MAEIAEWVKFITDSEKEDGNSVVAEHVKAVAKAIVSSPTGPKKPREAEGYNIAHVKKDSLSPPQEALLHRSFEAVEAARKLRKQTEMFVKEAEAKAKALAGSPSVGASPLVASAAETPPSKSKVDKIADLLGGHSAMELAETLAKGGKPNLPEMLKDANVQNMPHHLQPDYEVFKTLNSESANAKAESPSRWQFSYVDIQDRMIRPEWLGDEFVGGRELGDEGYEHIDMQSDSLSQMSRELQKLKKPFKLFRSSSHWQVAMLRWAVASVGSGQWSWLAHHSHIDMIMRMIETENVKHGFIGQYIALYYDERVRKKWCEMSRRNDPKLNSLKKLEEATLMIDETTLEAARARIGRRLARANMHMPGVANFRPPVASPQASDPVAESLSAKEDAANAAARKRSNDVAKQMARQQEDYLQKEAAMHAANAQAQVGFGGAGPQSPGGYPLGPDGNEALGFRRQAKRAQFMDQVFTGQRGGKAAKTGGYGQGQQQQQWGQQPWQPRGGQGYGRGGGVRPPPPPPYPKGGGGRGGGRGK